MMSEYTGSDGARLPLERWRVALRGPHHEVGADRAVVGHDAVRRNRRGRRLLVNRDAACAHHRGKSPRQLRRLDRRAVRRVRRPQRVGAVEPRGRLVGVEELVLVLPPCMRVLDRGACPSQLQGSARERDGAALGDSRVDALRRGRADHLVNRAAHRRVLSEGALAAAMLREGGHRTGEQGRRPATISARRSKTGDLAFHDGDRQVWAGFAQVVRGPQPRESCADDRDVDFDIASERRSRSEVVAARL